MLKETFLSLVAEYSENTALAEKFWSEIEENYSHRKRHYHTLYHLTSLLNALEEVKSSIADWNTILFTLFYHDAVYNALKNDNEEKSAELASERMQELGVPADQIARCCRQIIATKKHQPDTDADTNYFTDADLSILGASWPVYAAYADNVRKEYSMFPDLLYKPGRRKVLQHFLAMDRLFKTDHFHSKLENQARLNLQQELNELQ